MKQNTPGLRERKKAQTQERITRAAMELFLSRGFDATTLDDIAAAAEISKRSFFDYFPSKESVVSAWQDPFATALVEEVRGRPRGESLPLAAERALFAALGRHKLDDAIAVARLSLQTPALRARDQAKYEELEQALAAALIARVKKESDRLKARLVAMVLIGGLRIGCDAALHSGRKMRARNVEKLWSVLRELGESAAHHSLASGNK